MTTTLERLSAILTKEFKLQPDRLTVETPLQSLGIDSLGTVELFWHIEDAFAVKLPNDPVDLATLGDVVHFIDALIAQQGVVAVSAAPGAPALQAT